MLKEETDVAIMANGLMVAMALEAATELAGEGISVSVVNAASVKPLDEKTILRIAAQTRAVVTAEEQTSLADLAARLQRFWVSNCPHQWCESGIKIPLGNPDVRKNFSRNMV